MGIAQKVLSEWKGRETYMLLIGSKSRVQQKGTGSNDLMGLSSSGSNQAR